MESVNNNKKLCSKHLSRLDLIIADLNSELPGTCIYEMGIFANYVMECRCTEEQKNGAHYVDYSFI